jgi:hypothetical protein
LQNQTRPNRDFPPLAALQTLNPLALAKPQAAIRISVATGTPFAILEISKRYARKNVYVSS